MLASVTLTLTLYLLWEIVLLSLADVVWVGGGRGRGKSSQTECQALPLPDQCNDIFFPSQFVYSIIHSFRKASPQKLMLPSTSSLFSPQREIGLWQL